MRNRVRELREEAGWTQDDLAARLSVKRAAVSKYESDRVQLSADTLAKLAEIFGVSVDYIICRTDERNPGEKIRGTSMTPSVISQLVSEHPELFENWRELDEAGRTDALKYIKMLLKLKDVEDKKNIINLTTNDSNAN